MTPSDASGGVFATYRAAYAGLPRSVWWIALVGLVNRAGTMVMVFLPVWLAREHGLAEHQATAFMSFWGLGAVIGVPLGGWLTDRVGALPVQLASLIGVALGFVALAGQTDLTAIALIMFWVGVVGEAFRPANQALLSASCSAAVRTRAFALHRLAINVGWTMGPVAGGVLSEISWPLVFWVDAGTCVLAALLLFTVFRGVRTHVERKTGTGPGASDSPLRDVPFLALVGCLTLFGFTFMQFFSTFAIYLSEGLGWRTSRIGLLEALNPILIALFEMVLVHRLGRRNPLRIVAFGALLMGIGFGLLWISGAALWIAACVVLFTLGEMLEAPFTAGFVANRASDNSRGRYMALYGVSFSIALVAAPIFGGFMRWQFGWTALWIACGCVGVGASWGILLVARMVDREARDMKPQDGD